MNATAVLHRYIKGLLYYVMVHMKGLLWLQVCIARGHWQSIYIYVCKQCKSSLGTTQVELSVTVDFTAFSLFSSSIDVFNRKPSCLNPMACMVNGSAQVESHPELGNKGSLAVWSWPTLLLCEYGVFFQLLMALYGSILAVWPMC